MTPAKHAAEQPQHNEEIFAQFATADLSAKHKPTKRWLVVRQTSHAPDVRVCQHRWEWRAELCAHKLARNADVTGVFYQARRAES